MCEILDVGYYYIQVWLLAQQFLWLLLILCSGVDCALIGCQPNFSSCGVSLIGYDYRLLASHALDTGSCRKIGLHNPCAGCEVGS